MSFYVLDVSYIKKYFCICINRILCISDEIKREREFYRARGLPCPKDILPNAGEVEEEKANADAHAESDYHRTDEQVIISHQQIYLQEQKSKSKLH